ncbi:MAG: hypothetical protein IPM41_06885 [Sphingomonadales bacterium]|nr:hypothetical protein [Sphingomonadales bacterium]
MSFNGLFADGRSLRPAQTGRNNHPAEAGATVSVRHGPSVSFLARAEAAATPISIINPKKGNEDA